MLLGAVVQVALDAAALGVAAGHDARPRLAQLVGLLAHLVERGLQRGVELRVVQREPDLARQLGEHPVVVLGEGLAVDDRSTTISPSSSPAWLTGATRICSLSRPSSRAGSHTDAHAVPDTPARVTTGRSRGDTTRSPARGRAPTPCARGPRPSR